MTRYLLAGGLAAVLMGAAAIVPVVHASLEGDGQDWVALSVIAAGGGLMAVGLVAVTAGIWRGGAGGMPSGVRAAAAANALFLAFCSLELSDRLVRQDGKVFYWTTVLFAPALLLFIGLLAARPWAWWVSRATAALAVVWFLGFVVVLPFAPLHTDGVPVPWYGRLYMAAVTLAFAGIFAGAFLSLGRSEVQSYLGSPLLPPSADPSYCQTSQERAPRNPEES